MRPEAYAEVVIPTRRRERFLRETLESLAHQTESPRNVWVVEDGTPVEEGIKNSFSWCRWLENRRSPGASGARNTGLEMVTAPWVLFLDDDDILEPTFLERSLAIAGRRAAEAVVAVATGFHIVGSACDRAVIPEAGPVREVDLLARNVVGPTSFVLCQTEAVRSVGGFDESLPAAQDWDLWLRLAERGEILRIPEALGTYRVHGEGQISAPAPGQRYRRYRPFFDRRDRHPRADRARLRIAEEMYWWGVLMAWTGDLAGAEDAFSRALKHHPRHLKTLVMLRLLRTPWRRTALRLIYLGRARRMWLDDRREPLPLR